MDLSGALRCAITIAKWVLASRNPNMINLPKLEEKHWLRAIRSLLNPSLTTTRSSPLKLKVGGILIQVDKQTKASYATAEAAQSAALEMKKGHPIDRVSIFDSVEHSSRLVELLS